jgi:HSP20 family protein
MLPRLQRSATSLFAPLQRDINRFFEELGDGWDTFSSLRLSPQMDAIETKDGYEFSFELPGLTQDDVKVAVEDGLLTVSGEKKAEAESKDRNYRLVERTYGEFSRAVRLPSSVDAGRITASMKDGVLRVQAPRRPDAESKRIEIQTT